MRAWHKNYMITQSQRNTLFTLARKLGYSSGENLIQKYYGFREPTREEADILIQSANLTLSVGFAKKNKA